MNYFKKSIAGLSAALICFALTAPSFAQSTAIDTIVLEDLGKGDQEAAKAAVDKAREEAANGNIDASSRLDLDFLASFLAFSDGDYARALKTLDNVSLGNDLRHEALLNCWRGKINMSMRKFEDATKSFQAALFCTKGLKNDDPVFEPVLEGLTGSLIAQKKYAEAKEPCQRLIEATRTRYSEIYGKCPYLWANLTLGDIYRQIGTREEKLAQRNAGRAIINELMPLAYRLLKVFSLLEINKVRDDFRSKFVDSMQPKTLGERLCISAIFQI
jgi:tetratricopeptide (TPR) repeat protein